MERVDQPTDYYRTLIKRMVAEHASYQPSHGQIEPLIVCDEAHDRYLLLDIGWDGPRRVHGVILHVALINGKIWIEHDGTPPRVRATSGCAVA